jgi:hypothetical protein
VKDQAPPNAGEVNPFLELAGIDHLADRALTQPKTLRKLGERETFRPRRGGVFSARNG